MPSEICRLYRTSIDPLSSILTWLCRWRAPKLTFTHLLTCPFRLQVLIRTMMYWYCLKWHCIQWWFTCKIWELSHQKLSYLKPKMYCSKDVKSVVIDLDEHKLLSIIEESLENIVHLSLHNAQSCIWSVVNKFIEQVMLNLLHKTVIRRTLYAHAEKFFNNCAPTDRLSEGLFTLDTFKVPIAIFVWCKEYSVIEQQKYCTAFATNEAINTVKTYKRRWWVTSELFSLRTRWNFP